MSPGPERERGQEANVQPASVGSNFGEDVFTGEEALALQEQRVEESAQLQDTLQAFNAASDLQFGEQHDTAQPYWEDMITEPPDAAIDPEWKVDNAEFDAEQYGLDDDNVWYLAGKEAGAQGISVSNWENEEELDIDAGASFYHGGAELEASVSGMQLGHLLVGPYEGLFASGASMTVAVDDTTAAYMCGAMGGAQTQPTMSQWQWQQWQQSQQLQHSQQWQQSQHWQHWQQWQQWQQWRQSA